MADAGRGQGAGLAPGGHGLPDESPAGFVLPVVAIVGRPNVGKSTLFNRLTGQRKAIVADEPGTTRDRVATRVTGEQGPFLLVDTGGLVLEDDEPLMRKVFSQVRAALGEADVAVLVVDGAFGLHPDDMAVADMLRRWSRPVVLAVAKCEGRPRRLAIAEFYRLGLGEPAPVSALQNEGLADLMERVESLLPTIGEPGEMPADLLRLALVGRPNVGKSSLLNTITGEERAIVHEEPGTTRDTLDSEVSYGGQPMVLIDTAGLRRKGRIEPGVERFSSLRALQAIERCNVAVLVLDAQELITAQDAHIAGYVIEAYRGLVVAVNKWDLARERGLPVGEALKEVRRRLHWASYVPVHFVSAVTGEGVPQLLDTALGVFRDRGARVEQGELDRLLMEALGKHPPPSRGRRQLRFHRAAQTGAHPPTFTFYVNYPDMVHFSFKRYLQNTIRSSFGFRGSQLRLQFHKRVKGRRL